MQEVMQLYQSPELDQCLRANFGDDWQDVKQDVFERMLRLPPEQAAEIKNMRHYIIRVILNIKRQPYDPSAKLYRKSEPYTESQQPDEQYTEDEFHEQLAKVNSLPWYHQGIITLYTQLGTVRAVAEQTGIPFYSIKHTIKECRKMCK